MRLNGEPEAPSPQPQINTIISELFNRKCRSSGGQTSRSARRCWGLAALMKNRLASGETAGENHPASKNKDEKGAINMQRRR